MRLVCVQVKGGGNQGAGSRTLPSSNSSPVHSVPPPPHTSEYPTPHKLYSDPTQSHSDMKASGNRQPTTTENSEPISSAIVKYNYQVGELGE